MAAKFRKKPVVIEAVQYFDSLRVTDQLPEGVVIAYWADSPIGQGDFPTIHTLEGPHLVRDGDWIIKGVKGEFYACKPDIFEATYERVNDEETNEMNIGTIELSLHKTGTLTTTYESEAGGWRLQAYTAAIRQANGGQIPPTIDITVWMDDEVVETKETV